MLVGRVYAIAAVDNENNAGLVYYIAFMNLFLTYFCPAAQ